MQTSPAQACLEGSSGTDKSLVNTSAHPTWYYAYQPTYFTLGNYELGTAEEFKAMCDEAHKYGVKIVVDVVANHLADVLGDANKKKLVDQDLLNDLHSLGKITKWNDRLQVTQGSVIGMPDLNSESKAVQKKVSDYLVQCVDAGADGFRFDAAKSIALPTETAANAVPSDFWPTVMGAATAEGKTKNKDIYFYGEVLQGDEPGTNFPGYAKIMDVTASTYGWYLRSAVGLEVWENGTLGGNGTLGKVEPKITADLISPYIEGQVKDGSIANDQLVGFVETHDTYANLGASRFLTQNQIQLAWAMLAAREGVVPLYFNRPTAQTFTGDALHPQGEPYNTMGQKGSDDYKSANVVAINKFHNAMVGQAETVSAELNSKVMKIERGDKGLVLVNVGGDADFTLSTTLKDGTYTNQAAGGGTFTVKGGSISGKISGSSMIVLYDTGKAPVIPATETPTTTSTPATTTTSTPTSVSQTAVYYSKPAGWGDDVYAYIYKNGGKTENAKWPGVKMTKGADGIYSYEVPSDLKDGMIIFNDNGTNQYPLPKVPGVPMELGKLYKDGVWSTIVIKNPLTLSVTSDKESPQQKGSTIKLTAKGNGGIGALSYSFKVTGVSIPNATPTETLKSDNGVATWKPTESGNYNITVIVTDAAGAKESYTLSYSVCEIPPTPATTTTVTPATTTTVTPATTTTITPATTTTVTPVAKDLKINASAGTLTLKADEKTIITATSTDGNGTINYKFNVKIGNTTYVGQDYSTENKFEFTSSDAGKYEITVIAKDASGKEVTITKPIVINVADIVNEDTTPKVPDIPVTPASKTPVVDNDTTTVVVQKPTVTPATASTGTVSTGTVTNKDKEDKSTQNAPTMDSNSIFGVLAMMSLAGATLVIGKKKEKNI